MADKTAPFEIVILVAPYFNLSATTSFIDPFRVANYLIGKTRFSWRIACLTSAPLGHFRLIA